jgi:hypothetical protein
MSSIVIIGKGPSIKRCKREWIDKYDEVAICGRPIFNNYEHLIGDRAHIDFSNCGDLRSYPIQLYKKLGIKKIININRPIPRNKIKGDKIPDFVEYDPNGRENVINFFKNRYDLDPSSGTIALETILRWNKYNKIGIIGFDLMEVGEDIYYFPRNQVQQSLQVYFRDGTYTKNGKRIKKSGHNLDKTFKYMCDIFKNNKSINFELLSNRKFPKLKNLTLL